MMAEFDRQAAKWMKMSKVNFCHVTDGRRELNGWSAIKALIFRPQFA
jgi:hypothetical protein